MPRTLQDNDDEEWEEDESDENDTIPCPHCKRQIYDGAEQCPYCGHYISEEDAPRERKPLWIVVTAVICLAVAILWIWQG
ncbi:MAG: zinc-ribbon domain-containing protein [Planctomycetes bacterium]|nr:zinc-ribbon domain-containing protein [Planctomycetota bacterium]